MMLLWIVVLGGVIYAAVRLAMQHSQKPPQPPVQKRTRHHSQPLSTPKAMAEEADRSRTRSR